MNWIRNYAKNVTSVVHFEILDCAHDVKFRLTKDFFFSSFNYKMTLVLY